MLRPVAATQGASVPTRRPRGRHGIRGADASFQADSRENAVEEVAQAEAALPEAASPEASLEAASPKATLKVVASKASLTTPSGVTSPEVVSPRAHDFARIALGAGLGADLLALPESEDSQALQTHHRRHTRWAFSATGVKGFAVLLAALLGIVVGAVGVATFAHRPFPVAIQASGQTLPASASQGDTSQQEEDVEESASQEIMVYVSGAVKTPGVVTIAEHSRLVDAVQAAGGFTAEAQTAAINLAALAHDGQHIHVLKKSEDASQLPLDIVGDGKSTQSGAGNRRSSSDKQADGSGVNSEKINLNTASSSELEKIPGIGAVMAGRIIAWREQHGAFKAVKDLLDVDGIGQKTLAKIEPYVLVQ